MPRATARSSARRWGSRFDVISGPQLTDSSSLASDDAMTTSMTGASTTKTTEKASSESGFGDEPSSAASQLTATTATAANRSVLSDPNSASEGDAFSWGDEPHEASTPWGDNPPRPYPSANHNAPENLKPFNIMHSSPTQHHPTFSPSASLPARRLQRWNHNASVFVASLPPEPNAELDNYLRESLGKHGNILNIKFIHDVRSGNASNCAFVQFEVSVHSLYSPRRVRDASFLGLLKVCSASTRSSKRDPSMPHDLHPGSCHPLRTREGAPDSPHIFLSTSHTHPSRNIQKYRPSYRH